MSKIPKIGFGSNVRAKENIAPPPDQPVIKKTSSSNLGFKRPSEDNLIGNGKRHKNNIGSVVKRTLGNSALTNSAGSAQPAKKLQKFAAKDVFQPIVDTGVRASMPAFVSTTKVPAKTKRPKWDLKGRIQDMEEHVFASQEQNLRLKHEVETYNQRIAALEAANSVLHHDVEVKSVQSEEASSRLRQLESNLKQTTEEKEAACQELTTLRVEVSALRDSVATLTGMKAGLQAQLDAKELLEQNLRRENLELKNLCSEKDDQIHALLQKNAALETQGREGETLRRILHNEILELKGNIRVFCRLRPPLSEEQKNGMIVAHIVPLTNRSIEIQQNCDIAPSESGGKVNPKYEFSFDCYFSPTSSQEDVFKEISQLVQSALDGYNVCIFAYGQTGSGKTFTMEGPAEIVDFVADKDHPSLGVIPRSVQHVFDMIADLEPKGWKYRVETLFLEIYNERIQDLINPCSNAKCEIVKSGSKGTDCVVSNVTVSEVSSAEEVYKLMKRARINRVVAATKCNEYSSRSHYVFQMKLYGENNLTQEKCEATLNLVDLAGSERVKESASAGDRLTEAKAINKSLSNLGKVIMSLSQKDNHIPYRDSKLTHLLANSLGGNSKTLMFVNISPDNKSLSESINSLRFATKVNQCNIGTAQKRRK